MHTSSGWGWALAVSVLLGALPAAAAEWTRDTAHGGQVTRSITGSGPYYSGQTTRVGPNGGTYSSSGACRDGVVDRCRRSFQATGPNGQTYSGHRATARGPYQVRSIGTVTGPRGNVGIGARRHWR
ncbi:hypothetical protein EDC65_1597 [Stella humosa]|uniref:Uncharacterized protein n=1 Tax=Stella humosa TaxID=94 RepID=A0A3N1M9A8_9PROT|nr:hypothetical protein [Stella humosa]ROP99808.1 hypothetical protein EDC65_1597 [Stella humosa]BBK30964.1 hypothetical protein STHU_15980 [Stella humosa]